MGQDEICDGTQTYQRLLFLHHQLPSWPASSSHSSSFASIINSLLYRKMLLPPQQQRDCHPPNPATTSMFSRTNSRYRGCAPVVQVLQGSLEQEAMGERRMAATRRLIGAREPRSLLDRSCAQLYWLHRRSIEVCCWVSKRAVR